MCRLGKRALVMAIGATLLWINVSGATNRIYGILVKHGSFTVTVTLRGAPPENSTKLLVNMTVTVEHNCINPKQKVIDPGNPEFQNVPLSSTKTIASSAFEGNSLVEVEFDFTDDLEAIQCHQRNFIHVGGTSLVVAVEGDVQWIGKQNKVIEEQQILSCKGAMRGCGVFDEANVTFDDLCFPTQGNETCSEGLVFGCVQAGELTCLCGVHDSVEAVYCDEKITPQ